MLFYFEWCIVRRHLSFLLSVIVLYPANSNEHLNLPIMSKQPNIFLLYRRIISQIIAQKLILMLF